MLNLNYTRFVPFNPNLTQPILKLKKNHLHNKIPIKERRKSF